MADWSDQIYSFFTGDQTGINFITNIGLQVTNVFPLTKSITEQFVVKSNSLLQFAYQAVGYLSSHLVWQVVNKKSYLRVKRFGYLLTMFDLCCK